MRIILPVLLLMLFSSCKIYFTQELRQQLEEQKIDLDRIQFYTSKKIVLQRIITTQQVSEDTAKLIQVKETVIERIKIKRNLKGVCINGFDSELEIKFEPQDSCSLKFVRVDSSSVKSIYKIGAMSWVNNVGQVPYEGKVFYIRPRRNFFQPRSNDAALKVKRKFLHKVKVNRRKAKGIKVGEDYEVMNNL